MSDPIRSTMESTLRYDELVCRDPDDLPEAGASRLGSDELVCRDPSGAREASAIRREATAGGDAVLDTDETSRAAGVEALVRQNATERPALPVGNNNAERAARTELDFGYFDVGKTENGSYYVTAALFYGRDPKTGAVAEIGSLSAQVGRQIELQGTLLRVARTTEDGSSLTLEAGTAQASIGTHNKDGSRGLNASANATLGGGELTANVRGSSATLGASFAVGGEFSLGVRDADADGAQELCTRLAGNPVPVSGGLCLEKRDGWDR
ncbi:MAG: hypothetical protein DIU78_024265 [Pseudomonadota bacterium]